MIPIHKSESKRIHSLARFVTPEAIALILTVPVEDIREIRCWQRVILVIGRNFSRFVSYADLPPILGGLPTARDFVTWRKRWRKHNYKAPSFWQQFYTQKLSQAESIAELSAWKRLIDAIANVLDSTVLQALRSLYYVEYRACLHV